MGKEVHFAKFLRRPDINATLRFTLAYQALYLNEYGLITRLSHDHKVSREFIYQLRNQLQVWSVLIFGVLEAPLFELSSHQTNQELITISQILSLRLEGHCSISGIHLLLKRGGFRNNSVGYISELLNKIGSQLSNQVKLPEGMTKLEVVFAADEVFSKSKPILVTLDPISSVILRIELVEKRTAQEWQNHWQSLLNEAITPLLLTNDEGTGMSKAHKEVLSDIPRQSDTFHAIAHRLGDEVRKLHKKMYQAIEIEYTKERLWENSKSDAVLEKRTKEYEQALLHTIKTFKNYEHFSFLYQYIIESLAFFDARGNLNTLQDSQANIEVALNDIRDLDCCGQAIEKQLDYIQKLLPNLLNYLKVVGKIVESWKPLLDTKQKQAAFKNLCIAYQCVKNSRKIKSNKAKRYFLHLAEEQRALAKANLIEYQASIQMLDWWQKLQFQLEQVVQSSAMVETINSILRTYLNIGKNQLNQNHLNIIMFYLNHRRYLRGKRKGKTPMELLKGEKQNQDWLQLMLKEAQITP